MPEDGKSEKAPIERVCEGLLKSAREQGATKLRFTMREGESIELEHEKDGVFKQERMLPGHIYRSIDSRYRMWAGVSIQNSARELCGEWDSETCGKVRATFRPKEGGREILIEFL